MSILKKSSGVQLAEKSPEDYMPQHPLYSANNPRKEPFEDAEGLISWGKKKLAKRKEKQLKKLRDRIKKLCNKLKKPIPKNIDSMTMKELKALRKKIKPKKGSSHYGDWNNLTNGLGELFKFL